MTAINAWIRDAARRRELRQDSRPDPKTERQAAQRALAEALAEALVAQDVAAGALEGIARIHRGLDRAPDFGGGPRGTPMTSGSGLDGNVVIREAIERSRATGGGVDVDAVRREVTGRGW